MSDLVRLPPPERAPESEADAGRMLQILWRGKWILLALPLAALAGARLWLDRQESLYVATAQVQVDARAVDPLKSGAGAATNKPRTVLKQQQSLLSSTPILKRIAESPLLAGMRTFAPERLGTRTLVGALHDGLATNIDVESDRFFISFFSPFREEAITVVDEALRVFIEHHRERKRGEAEEIAAIVRAEWEATKSELAETEAAIERLQQENAVLAGSDRTPLQTKLDDASRAWNAAHLETQRLAAAREELEGFAGDPEAFRARGLLLRAKAQVPALEERYAQKEKERAEKLAEIERLDRAGLGTQHELLMRLRREAEALVLDPAEIGREYAEQALASAVIDHDRAVRIEAALAEEQRQLLAQVIVQNGVLETLKSLALEREHLRSRVANFDDRITQLGLEDQTGALNLTVIEHARAKTRPVYPETEKTYLYALGGSGILAFGLVLLLGLSDRRVRDVEAVPRRLGTSVLGVVPQLPRGTDRAALARLVEEDPRSLAAEAFRSARTAAAFALPDGGGVIVVASASAGEGRSISASNLAAAFARAGKRTLLVDADLRHPVQHEVYRVPGGIGLAGLLDSAAPLKAAIVPRVAQGLDLLPAGDARGRATELCAGPALAALFESLRASYDCVVVDTSPVLESSEARVLAALADGVVLVLRLGESNAPGLERAAGILRGAGARIVGCLPNGAASSRGARAYATGISYGPADRPTAPRSRAAGDDGEAGKARARGTDFLGLEDEEAA